MNGYTFEPQETKKRYESSGWDRIWLETPPYKNAPRVLVIGDSISDQYRPKLKPLLNGYLVNGYATSRALDNPVLPEMLSIISRQTSRCDAILFNSGLHGWHLDADAYREHLEQVLDGLALLFPGTPLALVLTTPVLLGTDRTQLGERDGDIRARNAVMREVAETRGLPVVDFYSAVLGHEEYWAQDAVHFAPAGTDVLVNTAAEQIKKML